MIETDSDATKAGASVDWMIDGGGSGVLLGVVAEDSFDHRVTEDCSPPRIEDNVCTGDTVPVRTDVPGRRRKAMVVLSVRVSVEVARLVTMENWKVVWVTGSN